MPFTETHQPCPDCGSSDGLAFNDDGSSKCFVCDTFTPAPKDNVRELGAISEAPKPSFSQTEHRLITAEYRSITDRLITGTTAKKYSALKSGEVTTFGYFSLTIQQSLLPPRYATLTNASVSLAIGNTQDCTVSTCSLKGASTSPSLKASTMR